MEVKINTKKQILKSFIVWLPLVLAAVVFYGVLFFGLITWALSNYAGLDQELTKQVGILFTGVILLLSIYVYLNWLTNCLSSYRLVVDNEELLIKGKAGWSSLDKVVPINTIQKIYIGDSANTLEKLSSWHGAVKNQVSSRLTFIPHTGKPFKLDFATKAFNNESLYEFLVTIRHKGVETNVSV